MSDPRETWLVIPDSWERLHYVVEIEWDDEDRISGYGRTACGLRRFLVMPGFLSRIGLPRCAHCCRRVGIPLGRGTPENEEWVRRIEAEMAEDDA